MGISPSNLSVIFDQFKQVEDAHTKNTGGTGLGLAICKQLTKLLGGEISVDSREGEGSVFRVKFQPTKIIPDEPEKMSCDLGPSNMSILVMEDNEDNILLLKMYFKKLPHRVKYFENGELGLDEFKSNSQDYDLVISDMQMPVMDGYMAVFEMRKFEESQGLPRKRIVALTAFAAGEDQKKSLDAGCDHVYHKPISKQDFKALLNAEASKVSQQES
jgi:CheY-like chemotaxis protein